MKTIEQVIALFPSTKPEQWKQHANGNGWVFETSYAAATALIGGIVSGYARVSGYAQVYGNAQVSGDAQVSGNAQVYGDAQVSGNAWVYGNAWVKSPLYIQGTRHSLTLASFNEIAIGCHVRTITEWQKKYKAIGRMEGYSAAEIKEYGEYIKVFAVAAKRFAEEEKSNG